MHLSVLYSNLETAVFGAAHVLSCKSFESFMVVKKKRKKIYGCTSAVWSELPGVDPLSLCGRSRNPFVDADEGRAGPCRIVCSMGSLALFLRPVHNRPAFPAHLTC